MQRRDFLFSTLGMLSGGVLLGVSHDSAAQTAGLDAVAEMKKLRITSGAFAGGYVIAPQGSLNWYFTNLGLISIVQYLSAYDLDIYIRAYLDLYLRHLEANFTIKDVTFAGGNPAGTYQLGLSDSDDSYAATFLSLAARYMRSSQNWVWWNANKARLKDMAYRNLAVAVKSNGLTSVFQAPRSQSNSIGYLMDNCEAYRGLRDFASMLRQGGETADANYYDSFADGIAHGISVLLFDRTRSGLISSDGDVQAGTSFYPGTTCQVFPQAFGLMELSSYFDQGWAYLNRVTPNWQDGRYDPYPWAILGFVAAKRQQYSQARAQMQTVQSRFSTNRGLITINELGFYQRTKSLLAGRPDI
jgi:hypothetical protein